MRKIKVNNVSAASYISSYYTPKSSFISFIRYFLFFRVVVAASCHECYAMHRIFNTIPIYDLTVGLTIVIWHPNLTVLWLTFLDHLYTSGMRQRSAEPDQKHRKNSMLIRGNDIWPTAQAVKCGCGGGDLTTGAVDRRPTGCMLQANTILVTCPHDRCDLIPSDSNSCTLTYHVQPSSA